MGQLKQREFAEMEKTAELIVGRVPTSAQALEWLGVVRFARGRQAEGIALIERRCHFPLRARGGPPRELRRRTGRATMDGEWGAPSRIRTGAGCHFTAPRSP